MKTKLAHIVLYINKIDYRYIQLASLAVMLVGFLFTQSPSDSGGGPI